MGFSSYTKLYHASVCPVLDYVAGVWAYKVYKGCEQVYNRALRYFLGVNKRAPILAITGDIG